MKTLDCIPSRKHQLNGAFRNMVSGVVAIAWAISHVSAQAPGGGSPHFDVNDISFLFPAPKSATDINALISIDTPLADGKPLVPVNVLNQVLDAALKANAGQDPVEQITFNDEPSFRNPHNWKIVGIRVDPSAPGSGTKDIADFGSSPQVRLIVQPVTVNGDGVVIHDFAMHLVFELNSGGGPAIPSVRTVPDKVAFQSVLGDLQKIKTIAETDNVPTEGQLGVNPALAAHVPGYSDGLRSMIQNRLSGATLQAIAFMGVHLDSEPWIFFAMIKDGDGYVALPPSSIGGEILSFQGGSPAVIPAPATRNSLMGVSTAPLFADSAANNMDAQLFPLSTDPQLQRVKLRDIPDIIANPLNTGFFRTDCISCHSESTRRAVLHADNGSDGFAFQRASGISGVSQSVLPTDPWNVRNFGWSPFGAPETVSMRTANEAAASVDFINREYFSQATSSSSQGSSELILVSNTTSVDSNPTSSNALPTQTPVALASLSPQPTTPSAVPSPTPVANALTLVMTIKSKKDYNQLVAMLKAQQNPSQDTINQALTKLGMVHFARFVFLGQNKLMVITNYDGTFSRYIGAFTDELGPIFDTLLSHMSDAPPRPVQNFPKEFLKYVTDHDLSQGQPGYCAYPQLSVHDILTLQKNKKILAPSYAPATAPAPVVQ